jgi:hypothetical protein
MFKGNNNEATSSEETFGMGSNKKEDDNKGKKQRKKNQKDVDDLFRSQQIPDSDSEDDKNSVDDVEEEKEYLEIVNAKDDSDYNFVEVVFNDDPNTVYKIANLNIEETRRWSCFCPKGNDVNETCFKYFEHPNDHDIIIRYYFKYYTSKKSWSYGDFDSDDPWKYNPNPNPNPNNEYTFLFRNNEWGWFNDNEEKSNDETFPSPPTPLIYPPLDPIDTTNFENPSDFSTIQMIFFIALLEMDVQNQSNLIKYLDLDMDHGGDFEEVENVAKNTLINDTSFRFPYFIKHNYKNNFLAKLFSICTSVSVSSNYIIETRKPESMTLLKKLKTIYPQWKIKEPSIDYWKYPFNPIPEYIKLESIEKSMQTGFYSDIQKMELFTFDRVNDICSFFCEKMNIPLFSNKTKDEILRAKTEINKSLNKAFITKPENNLIIQKEKIPRQKQILTINEISTYIFNVKEVFEKKFFETLYYMNKYYREKFLTDSAKSQIVEQVRRLIYLRNNNAFGDQKQQRRLQQDEEEEGQEEEKVEKEKEEAEEVTNGNGYSSQTQNQDDTYRRINDRRSNKRRRVE